LASTEFRSRDEWLAEVRRRGRRLRRRRRIVVSLVSALAMVLPVGAVTAVMSGEAERGAQGLSVAGPGPSEGIAPVPEEPTTTTTAPERLAPPPPSTTTTVPPVDDPVVRSATTTTTGLPAFTPPSTTVPPESDATPEPCTAAEFRLTVAVEKDAYRFRETVRGSRTLEKRSTGRCRWPDWGFEFKIVDGIGNDVFDSARSHGYSSAREPHPDGGLGGAQYAVGPGVIETGTFQWEALDCRKPPPGPLVPAPGDDSWCVPFPPGTYTVLVPWTGSEGGSPAGPPAKTTFQLSS
jgi:hypothetical protein